MHRGAQVDLVVQVVVHLEELPETVTSNRRRQLAVCVRVHHSNPVKVASGVIVVGGVDNLHAVRVAATAVAIHGRHFLSI